MPGPARILLLADEPLEAERLKRLLSETAPDRGAQLVTSEKEALAALDGNDFEIVFAAFAGGALQGAQFLNEAWKRRPKTVRFLFADSVDSDVMVTCALGAHHFLPKPVERETIVGALTRADAINRFVRNERIQSLVSRMRTLPSRPSLYLEVMRELRSPNASPNTVGEMVSKDLAISTKLIQVVNSAFYGLQQQVTDPAAAVLLLGLETTASLVLSIEAFARFDKVKPLYFSMDRVWKHSQSVAQSSKRIAELMSNDLEVARHSYTAGLLHDIGKLALALNFEDQYHGALKLAEKQKLSPCEVESQVFGATHAEAGAYLLSLWGLPLPIVEAVADHHLAAKDVPAPFSAATALHVAERLEREADLRRSGVKDIEVDLAYRSELELTPRMTEFRRIVRGEQLDEEEAPVKAEHSEGTMIFTRQELKATPAPLPASGEPAPVVNVIAGDSSKKPASRKTIVAAIGAVALMLVIGLAYVISSSSNKEEAIARAEKAEQSANPAERRILSNSIVGASEQVTRPIAAITPVDDAAGKLKLQAILFNGEKSALVINGRPFRLGDEIEGARIVAVERQEITIEKAGAQRKLTLP